MSGFSTRASASCPDGIAPDGSEVRLLAELESCGMAEFRMPGGKVSQAVRHRTVQEIWYIVSGAGQMWRCGQEGEEVIELRPGLSLTIPVGTDFQFLANPGQTLTIVGVTIPRWPGPEEAELREGYWPTGEYPVPSQGKAP